MDVGVRRRRDLFGGTVRNAGLASAMVVSCNAMADFHPDPWHATLAYYEAHGIIPEISEVAYDFGGFPGPAAYSGPGLEVISVARAAYMGTSIQLTDPFLWDDAHTILVSWFVVTESEPVTLEWQFSNLVEGYASLWEDGDEMFEPIEGGAGSLQLTLEPGHLYRLWFIQYADEENNNGFVRLTTVPAMGGLALVGLGMLGTRRRRRS